MSREHVIRLHRTGKTLKNYFENKFHDAMYTDLHIYTDEPDAMIALFMMEEEARHICSQVKKVMSDQLIKELEEQVLRIFNTS
tara:strand:- start:549 stop:797 length:249 start_codon:yes stop_codon:yes gene_type:complete